MLAFIAGGCFTRSVSSGTRAFGLRDTSAAAVSRRTALRGRRTNGWPKVSYSNPCSLDSHPHMSF